jgi:membrane protease YdiL (CAAX protease family)
MSDVLLLSGFLAAVTAATIVWARSLWYLSERSSLPRRAVFFVLGRSHRAPGEIRACVLSLVYYGLGLLAILLFVTAFKFPLSTIAGFRVDDVPWVVIGAVGEISLSCLLVELGCRFTGNQVERYAEIGDIPWMKALGQLPPTVAPAMAALAGAIEEAFFRGALLGILTRTLFVAPLPAVVIAGGLFCLGQLLQVQTTFQAMVIASASIAISVLGGLLVMARGSVVPAILCHISFVVFFFTQGLPRKRTLARTSNT